MVDLNIFVFTDFKQFTYSIIFDIGMEKIKLHVMYFHAIYLAKILKVIKYVSNYHIEWVFTLNNMVFKNNICYNNEYRQLCRGVLYIIYKYLIFIIIFILKVWISLLVYSYNTYLNSIYKNTIWMTHHLPTQLTIHNFRCI